MGLCQEKGTLKTIACKKGDEGYISWGGIKGVRGGSGGLFIPPAEVLALRETAPFKNIREGKNSGRLAIGG